MLAGGFFGMLPCGTMARLKPCLAASEMRSGRSAPGESPRQPHFAEHHQIVRQRPIAQARNQRHQQRQIGAGLADFHPADHVDEHVLIRHLQPAVPVQHRQQDRQPVLLGPTATRRGLDIIR